MSACSGSCSSGWPKALALPGVGAGQRQAATHERDCADAVPHPRDAEHRLDRARAVQRRADQGRARAIEQQLGGRHLARAELVLEPVDADAVQLAVEVADLDVEHREALAARRIALGARERERVCLAGRQNRVVLTRDRLLLHRKAITHGYWVRSHDPVAQVAEVLRRFQLDATCSRSGGASPATVSSIP